jgi:UDP-N-acetylmuramoyl-tripeptide--D-alanyl-D-alanine ligase
MMDEQIIPVPMNPTKLEQIAEFAGATLVSGDADISVQKVSTDSRTTKRGDLFVALRGEKFDGHKFVEAAAETGAAGAIVDLNWKGTVPKNFAILQVDDTLRAYQNLAANDRKSLPIKVLAITGSNGKPAPGFRRCPGSLFSGYEDRGNFNNHRSASHHAGATSQDEIAVWEIGMNHPGETAHSPGAA